MKMNPDEVDRLLKRAKQFDSERQHHLNEAARKLKQRTRIVAMLRDNNVPWPRITRALDLSRAALEKQLGQLNEPDEAAVG